MRSEFFELHSGLDREGPGTPEDVAWAASVAGLKPNARICDAACGPGADTETLLALAPNARLTAVDAHQPFVDDLLGRIGPDARVTAFAGDMLKVKGPFDLIWCAGAVYFVGIAKALAAWRPCIAKGGMVAFSEPCFFVEYPSAATSRYWEGYATRPEGEVLKAVSDAGYRVLGTRRLPDASWAAYHQTMSARIAQLRAGASAALSDVLDEGDAEIRDWQDVKNETGYLLIVCAPA